MGCSVGTGNVIAIRHPWHGCERQQDCSHSILHGNYRLLIRAWGRTGNVSGWIRRWKCHMINNRYPLASVCDNLRYQVRL